MKPAVRTLGTSLLATGVLAVCGAAGAFGQDPIITPLIVNTAAPIVVKAVTPKTNPAKAQKFQGYYMHANAAQVTLRAMGNDMAVRTFALDGNVSAQMQKIIAAGGYKYGDKITVYYDPATLTATKIKGKPSRPL